MGLVFRQTVTCYRNACPSALMRCRCGWLLTGCCSTLPRLRCCGANLLSVNIRSQQIGNTSVVPVSVVHDLGVYIDDDLTMSAHITATVRACFAALRHSLTREALLTLLRALVVTNVDYCSSTLAGVSSALLQRLQSCVECQCSTGVLCKEVRTHHATSPWTTLVEIPERIQFRLCVLTHRCLHGTAPPYLAETLQSTADVQGRRRLRSASTSKLVVPPTKGGATGGL